MVFIHTISITFCSSFPPNMSVKEPVGYNFSVLPQEKINKYINLTANIFAIPATQKQQPNYRVHYSLPQYHLGITWCF